MASKRIKKRFFSSIAEREWLESLGEKGYRLVLKKENSYTFELTEQRWHYCVEWLDCAPDSEDGEAYIASLEEKGIFLAATYSLWAYFISEEPIAMQAEAKQRVALRYRNTAFLLFAADAIVAVLIGYHFAIRGFLEANHVVLEAPTMEASGNVIINLCRRLVYGAEIILYRYGKLCSSLFGNTKASLVLGILIPLAFALSVMGALWLAEWLKNRPLAQNISKREDDPDVCEKSETQGETESHC